MKTAAHHHEAIPGPSDAGCVVLDIGPGAGAAVVVTPASLCGREMEVRRAGNPWDGRHVAVRSRHGAGATSFAAIFGALPPGPYEFRVRGDDGGGVVLRVHVGDAGVALAHWPGADSAPDGH